MPLEFARRINYSRPVTRTVGQASPPGRQAASAAPKVASPGASYGLIAPSVLPQALTPGAVRRLQQTAGNVVVLRLLARSRAASAANLLRAPNGPRAGPVADAAGKGTKAVNQFPFGAESKSFMRDYVDERATVVAVNLLLGKGMVFLTVEGLKDPLRVELGAFHAGTVDLLPIFPEANSLAEAQAQVQAGLIEALKQKNMVPCFFYRGQGGLIWPSLFNEQTMPRIVPTLRRAEAAEREAAGATADTFKALLFWYVGARFPLRTKAPSGTAPAAAAGAALKSLTPLQRTIAAEAQAILRSKELVQIKAAHAAGKSLEVVINGRTILYEPTLKASGMSLFGENGFIIGREAFKTGSELTKTLLHELHRLATTVSKAEGVSGPLATAETANAASFADDLYGLGVKVGLW